MTKILTLTRNEFIEYKYTKWKEFCGDTEESIIEYLSDVEEEELKIISKMDGLSLLEKELIESRL